MKKLLAALVLVLLLTACTATPTEEVNGDQPELPVEYVYTKETVTYTEKNEQYSFRMDLERTETEHARYFFEKKVTEEQRRACIESTEQILAQLGKLADLPEICVLTPGSYDSVFVEGNRLFVHEQDWQSREYATNVLMAVYGDYSHYGLAFGYADLLCRRLGWSDGEATAFVMPSVAEVCDLGLLCFKTAFVSDEDAAAASQLACHFAASCDEAELRKLLAESDTTAGMEAVSAALSGYYAENGVSYQPTTVRYGFGGKSYDYVVESDIGVFYLFDGWYDRRREFNPLVSENFLHENYAEVKVFFEINLRQMQQYRDTINLYPYEEDIVFLLTDDPYLHVSYTDMRTNRMYMINVLSMMHEYIHMLTRMDNIEAEPWQTEGFARYLDLRYDYYGAPATTNDWNTLPDTESFHYVHEYMEKMGRPLDMAADYLVIYDLYVYYNGATSPNQNSGYIPGASFIHYLVKQYGEQRVIQSIYGDGEPLPKDYDELVEDWLAYINETYRDYSKQTDWTE